MAIITRAAVAVAATTIMASGCSSGGGAATPDVATSSTLTPLVISTTTSPTTTSTTTSTSTSTSTTTTTSTTLPPTTTTEPIITQGGVLLVANASSVPGAGGRLVAALTDVGFTVQPAVNAAGNEEDLATSHIYALDVNDPVASSVSRLMGGIPVLRWPTPIPVDGADAGDATVVIMLGTDLAGAHLATD